MSHRPYHNGWLVIHRNIYDDPAFKHTDKFSEKEAYIWLLAQAVFRECVTNVAGRHVKLERGQLCYTHRFLAIKWAWSDSATYRYLKKLERWNKIETHTETGVTVITICNYDLLQCPSLENETDTKQEKSEDETNKKKSNQFQQEIKNPPYNPPFQIERLLSDEARNEVYIRAPGWDKIDLMNKFDEMINNGLFEKPKNIDAAFLAFCSSFTKGKPPS